MHLGIGPTWTDRTFAATRLGIKVTKLAHAIHQPHSSLMFRSRITLVQRVSSLSRK